MHDLCPQQGAVFAHWTLQTFSDKLRIINSHTCKAGSVAVIDTGNSTGHVAVVESCDKSGSMQGIKITEANWKAGKITRRSSRVSGSISKAESELRIEVTSGRNRYNPFPLPRGKGSGGYFQSPGDCHAQSDSRLARNGFDGDDCLVCISRTDAVPEAITPTFSKQPISASSISPVSVLLSNQEGFPEIGQIQNQSKQRTSGDSRVPTHEVDTASPKPVTRQAGTIPFQSTCLGQELLD